MGKKDSIISKKESDFLHRANLTKRGLTLVSGLEKNSAIKRIDKGQNEMRIILAPSVQIVFVRVPAGSFLMGTRETNFGKRFPKGYKGKLYQFKLGGLKSEQPKHKVYLEEYWIGKYPVTNKQYITYTTATNQNVPYHWSPPKKKFTHPVWGVSWYNARAFCQWLSNVTCIEIRLPSEAEWEKAARGTDGRKYPWGDREPDPRLCNFFSHIGDTTRVGSYSPEGDSPYGCADMVGNVWEWTNSLWGKNLFFPDFRYPYRPMDGRENTDAGDNIYRILRGGSWGNRKSVSWLPQPQVRVANRERFTPDFMNGDNGFRCACSF